MPIPNNLFTLPMLLYTIRRPLCTNAPRNDRGVDNFPNTVKNTCGGILGWVSSILRERTATRRR